jgi:hypothetical protein
LEENKYIAKYVEKPIHLTNLIELVADLIIWLKQSYWASIYRHYRSYQPSNVGSK